MTSCAWLWIYAGCGLMLLELIVPGFILCFFGIAAATVGACRFLFGEGFSLTWQLAAFSFFSVLYLALLRRGLKSFFGGNRSETKTDFEHELVGRAGRVTVAVDPPLAGRVMIGDSEWTAESDRPLAVGANVKVVGQSNLTLRVAAV